MDQSATLISLSVSLRTQIARMCVLDRYLIEAFDLQQVEPSLREHAPAEKLVHRTLIILHEQLVRLESLARCFVPGPQGDFFASSVLMAGLFMKFISKRRARTVAAMLHDDRVMLRLATTNYTLLHRIGTNLGVGEVSELARHHLEQLNALACELRRLGPGPEPAVVSAEVEAGVAPVDLPDLAALAAARC